MTPGPKSLPKETAVAAQSNPGGLSEVGFFEEAPHAEPWWAVDPTGHGFSPLLSWLVATGRPTVTVELGPGDRASLVSTCNAVSRLGAGARCLAVRLSASTASAHSQADAFGELVNECTKSFGSLFTAYDDEMESLRTLTAEANVDLLHVTLLDLDDQLLPDLPHWFGVLAQGATVVVTSTMADRSSSFAKAKQLVSDRYPSVCMSLGLTTEALVAQVPIDGSAPIIELLQDVPSAVGSLLAMFGDPVEAYDHLGDEPVPPQAVRVLVAGLIERQRAEREAFLSALAAYKDLSAQLTVDVADARRDLAAQAESARLERERLVTEFLDRLDVLSAKISTSAARYSAQLEEKDRLLEEHEQRALAYAGLAATAQSVIDDIHRSSSWRFTAPLRLMSRMMARRRSELDT